MRKLKVTICDLKREGAVKMNEKEKMEVAVNVSVKIMRTFVEMRRFFVNNSLLFEQMSEIKAKQLEYQKSTNEKFDEIFTYISEHEEVSQKIFFEGQIYDAFSLLTHLVSMSLLVNYTNMFHDRFFVIDDSLAYHIGASLKDAGKKCFAINKIEDKMIVEDILNRLSSKEGGE